MNESLGPLMFIFAMWGLFEAALWQRRILRRQETYKFFLMALDRSPALMQFSRTLTDIHRSYGVSAQEAQKAFLNFQQAFRKEIDTDK